MKYALYLGKALGVKIYVHWTFVFLIGWIVVSGLRNNLPLNIFFWTFGLILAVFACIVLHELGHAIVARRYGISTKHITLLPIGGIAQLESMPDKPRQELLIAVAGPAVNIIVAALLFPFVDIHKLIQPESLLTINTTNFLFSLMVVNLWLALFNLIPAFPMDGGRVLRATLALWIDRTKATKIAAGLGQVFGLVFFFAGFLYSPMLIFIGLLIFLGGNYEYALVDTLRLLQSFTIKDALMREVPLMEGKITLREAGEQILNTQNKNFLVVSNHQPIGIISRDEVIRSVHEKGENEMLDKVMTSKLTYAELSMPLDAAWKIIRDEKVPMLLVGSNGHVDGIVDEENIAEFIQLKSGAKIKKERVG